MLIVEIMSISSSVSNCVWNFHAYLVSLISTRNDQHIQIGRSINIISDKMHFLRIPLPARKICFWLRCLKRKESCVVSFRLEWKVRRPAIGRAISSYIKRHAVVTQFHWHRWTYLGERTRREIAFISLSIRRFASHDHDFERQSWKRENIFVAAADQLIIRCTSMLWTRLSNDLVCAPRERKRVTKFYEINTLKIN